MFNLDTWQFQTFAYIIFILFFYYLYKITVNKTKNESATFVIFSFGVGLAFLVFSLFSPYKFPSDWRIYLLLFIACFFYALSDRLQVTIRKNMEVSVVSF